MNLREELDEWRLHVKTENIEQALCRLHIAIDELRARLAPSKYPNLEISDEGYLWFNADTSIGIVEILSFPFGFKEIKTPSIAVSLPRKAKDVNLGLLNKLRQLADNISGAKVSATKSGSEVSKILSAYKHNEHPSLIFTSELKEILDMKRKDVFLSYFGLFFPVDDKTVSDVEHIIRDVLLKLEEK
jgi:hypothetical protein